MTMHSIIICLKIFQDFIENAQIMTHGSYTTLSDFLRLNDEFEGYFQDLFLTEHSHEQSRKQARNFSSSDRSPSVFHNSSAFVRGISNIQSSIVEGFDEIKHVLVDLSFERRVFNRLKFVDIIKRKSKIIHRYARKFTLIFF